MIRTCATGSDRRIAAVDDQIGAGHEGLATQFVDQVEQPALLARQLLLDELVATGEHAARDVQRAVVNGEVIEIDLAAEDGRRPFRRRRGG